MNESQDPILDLDKRLNELIRNELQLRQQIDGLKHEIYQIKLHGVPPKASNEPDLVPEITLAPQNPLPIAAIEQTVVEPEVPFHVDMSRMFNNDDVENATQGNAKKLPSFDVKQDLEKFIGENLINKIGILILVLGVGIGTRYAIDHDMISPLARILLGYLVGIGLLGTAFRLKPKFENFSAVLLSGAMAILYLLTFAAYDLYQLIPQFVAFGIMVFFTGFTVFAAIQYNRPIIAHLGLVGAYAVPFLLSSGSGQVGILFSYMALLNGGILVVAFQRYWQSLHFISFGFTWLIFISWLFTKFNIEQHLVLGLGFSTLFLVIFYISFLSYRLVRNEVFESVNLLLVLINATVYFLTGMFILGQQKEYASFEGLFTFVNAVLHFGVALLLKSRKPENKQLLVMLGGLVIVFITIAIPVQLEGNFVTVLWIAFASFMVFLGKKYSEPLFDRISVGLVVLAVLSLLQDWDKEYHHFNLDSPEKWLTPILNGQFLSSALFLGCLRFIWKILKNQAPETKSQVNPILIQKAIPGLILGILFGACCMEISNFWYQLSENSRYVNTSDVNDYNHFGFDPAFNLQKRIWLLLFAFLYWGAISFANSKVTRDVQFAIGLMVIHLMIIFQFLFSGLMDLDELQNLYFQSLQDHATFTGYSPLFIVLRYVSFAFLGLSVWSIRKNLETYGITQMSFQWFELFAYFILLIITSNECIYWISRMDETASYKLGLSIFWGIYALVLISLGIGQKKKYLRIFAIVLFGITLLKLFFFDIAHLTTILKTVVLVSLGILLLVISFLYNKFQDRLNHE